MSLMSAPLAASVLQWLDGNDTPGIEERRFVSACGSPQKLHASICQSLQELGWRRGPRPMTDHDLMTTPWMSPWNHLVGAQISRLQEVCDAVAKKPKGATTTVQVEDGTTMQIPAEGESNG